MRRTAKCLLLVACLVVPGETFAQTLTASLSPADRATGNFVVTRSGATITVSPAGVVTVVGGARLSGAYGGRNTAVATQTVTIECRGGSGGSSSNRCRDSEFRIFIEPIAGSSSGAATTQLSLDGFSFGSTSSGWQSSLPTPVTVTPSATSPALTLRSRDNSNGNTLVLTFRAGVRGTLSGTSGGEARWAYRVRVQRVRL